MFCHSFLKNNKQNKEQTHLIQDDISRRSHLRDLTQKIEDCYENIFFQVWRMSEAQYNTTH